MGFFDSLFGKSQAEASRRAAADTYAKQQQAISDLTNFGDQYASNFSNLSKAYDPYVQAGGQGLSQLQALVANPSSITSTPGYKFNMEQGIQGLDRSAASRGLLNSGRNEKDVMRFSQGLAENTYGNEFNRLLQMSGMGQAATGAQVGTQAQGLAGQLGTRTSAYTGGMNSASTTGLGDIAAEQAKSSALQNILGSISYLGGSAMGGGFGTSLGKKLFG